MTISNRTLLAMMALVAGAVGLSMYIGLRIGLDASAAQPDPQVLAMAPAAAAAPVAPAAVSTAPATLTTDQCAFLMDVDDASADDTAGDATGAWYDTGAETSVEQGDFATNSGVIDGSQFNDGGFGDIGQQWWGVTVNGNVTNVNVDQGGSANVNVGADQVAPAPTPPAPAPTPDPQPVAAPTPTQPVAPPTPTAPVGPSGDAPTGTASAGSADAAPVLADAAP